jgi:hypothetical protein
MKTANDILSKIIEVCESLKGQDNDEMKLMFLSGFLTAIRKDIKRVKNEQS